MPAGSILVADDDAAIRTVLNQALSRAGYEVRSTSNAATLWRWVSQGEGDLVITDVIMPGMSGPQVAHALGQMRGPVPVLFISGGHEEVVVDRGTGPESAALLTKPFTTDMLLRKIRTLLDAPGAG